ncbi:Cbb3-type cytochrome c oxidase subunit FixP [Gammaproteobacteria bacterium]
MSEQHGAQGNPFPGEPNTGHVWDNNLRELTNPPPKWWMWGLHASWIFTLAYFLAYPSIPLLSSHTKGFLHWTSMSEYRADLKEIEQVRLPYEKRIAALSATDILKDKELSDYSQRTGKVLFGDNCAACHGANGAGNVGFPVLADDDWLYGGTIDKIQESITGGRSGVMLAFAQQLSPQDIDRLAQYVLEWSAGTQAADTEGKRLFTSAGCVGCHGADGKGNQLMGSANLTDKVWRFSHEKEDIKRIIAHGVNFVTDPETRRTQMPAWGQRLSATDIKKLAIFVHELGGGK